MIDQDKVKGFWDARAQAYQELPFESIANLEQDAENLQLKIELETKKIFDWLGNISGKNILDLGAGVGQWSFRFAEKGASVVAVEYSDPLAEIGRKEAEKRGVNNLKFITSSAEDFKPEVSFDIVFISGLFVYMNDDQAIKFMKNLPLSCNKNTIVVLRDGTGIKERHEINNKFSEHLKVPYSATYRNREEYLQLFSNAGFTLIKDENMFDEGCVLNKYNETRLRVFQTPGS